jgi:hypothetical protein
MMPKRRHKRLEVDEQQAAEFYRMLADYNAAIAQLPPNWRGIAEGKVKLPETWDEARAQLGDAFAGVVETVQ